MKHKFKILTVVFLITISSCKKEDKVDNFQACTNIILESPNESQVSAENEIIAENLFNSNEIDFNNLQITKVQKDDYDKTHIRCYQFFNGLKIFTGDLIFHFNENEKYDSLSGEFVTNISLNTQSNLDNDILKNEYLTQVENDPFYSSKISELIENCLDLQFGYYDLNAGISYQPEDITKAWKITPHNKEYPILFINDETSEIIYYFNGIITN